MQLIVNKWEREEVLDSVGQQDIKQERWGEEVDRCCADSLDRRLPPPRCDRVTALQHRTQHGEAGYEILTLS